MPPDPRWGTLFSSRDTPKTIVGSQHLPRQQGREVWRVGLHYLVTLINFISRTVTHLVGNYISIARGEHKESAKVTAGRRFGIKARHEGPKTGSPPPKTPNPHPSPPPVKRHCSLGVQALPDAVQRGESPKHEREGRGELERHVPRHRQEVLPELCPPLLSQPNLLLLDNTSANRRGS